MADEQSVANTEIQIFLDERFSEPACCWCKDRDRKLYGKRLPLCGSCKHLKALVRNYKQRIAARPPLPPRALDLDRSEFEVAQQLKALAEQDGREYGNVNSRIIEGIDLEEIFGKVSRICIGRNIFEHSAAMFSQYFTLAQRRLLFYWLSRILRPYELMSRRMKVRFSVRAAWAEDSQ
jgi:hypothetical protein